MVRMGRERWGWGGSGGGGGVEVGVEGLRGGRCGGAEVRRRRSWCQGGSWRGMG